jgi:peptidoglycan/xylan/chitin deacetylase (PgdA/CDA1 family)
MLSDLHIFAGFGLFYEAHHRLTADDRYRTQVHRAPALTAASILAVLLTGCGGGEAPRALPSSPQPSPPLPTLSTPPPPSSQAPPPPPRLTGLVEHGKRTTTKVALTFDADLTAGMRRSLDAGKVASYANDKLVAELRELKVPATFFVAGLWAERYPEKVKDWGTDPLFEMASHSYSHRGFAGECYGLGKVPAADMAAEAAKPLEIMQGLGVKTVPYFRFPGGCHDAAALKAVESAGLTAVQWDVVGGDADAKSPPAIVTKTLKDVRGGSVVVLHVSLGPAQHTAGALPEIIAGLRAKGLEPVKLSELLRP